MTTLYDPTCPPGSTPEQIARPLRTVEVRTFPRLTDEEMAALFGVPFAGTVKS